MQLIKYYLKKYLIITIIINSIILFADNKNNIDSDWQIDNNALCGGCYLEPKYPLSLTKNLPADSIIINADTNKITKNYSVYNGNVVIGQNNQQLTANYAIANYNQKGEIESFKASGNVTLLQPGIRVIGEQATYIPDKKYKIINNANYRFYKHHGRGNADSIEIINNEIIVLPNASYTTCQPNNNTWVLKTKKLILNKMTGRGTATNAKLLIKDTPVGYLPYINFPINKKRHTGWLTPTFGRDSVHGTSIGAPFYWNIADNYDYLVTPIYMSKTGIKLDNKFRYLTRKSFGNINFNFLPRDQRYNKFRYILQLDNNARINNNWELLVKYNKARDNNYLYDFGKDLEQTSTQHLEQSLKLENTNNYGVLNFRVLQYQTLYPTNGPKPGEQYKKLPEVSWNSNYHYWPKQFRFKYNINYTNFELRKIENYNQSIGTRVHFLPTLERPYYTASGYINPRLQVDNLYYQNKARAIPVFDITNSLIFTRNISNNIEQTLEPKLYYLYIPKVNQEHYPIFDTAATEFNYDQLFRYNRYNGPDRLADANQVTFGAKSGFYQNGEEKAAIKIARAFYLRKLTPHLNEPLGFNNWSPIAIVLNYQLNRRLSFEANIVRQNLTQTRSNAASFQYKFAEQKIINLGYQYNKFAVVPERQIQTSFLWAIQDNINLLGRLDYDLFHKKPTYSLAGVEINKCCIMVRIAMVRTLLPTENLVNRKYSNKVLAQIVLKGLGDGVGSLGENTIMNKIPGYVSNKYRF